ncbi:MAG TPA: hypothetical protein VFR15_19845, partial [Chloroflexia bacterium]|nr:hypothetical protein [Chloroflexia bacterium]
MSHIDTTNRSDSPAGSFGPVARPKRNRLADYFIHAYAITWLALLGALAVQKLGLAPSESPVLSTAMVLGVFAPAVAALVIAACCGHGREVLDLLKKV